MYACVWELQATALINVQPTLADMASCTGSQQLNEQVWITCKAYGNLLAQVRLAPIYPPQKPSISL